MLASHRGIGVLTHVYEGTATSRTTSRLCVVLLLGAAAGCVANLGTTTLAVAGMVAAFYATIFSRDLGVYILAGASAVSQLPGYGVVTTAILGGLTLACLLNRFIRGNQVRRGLYPSAAMVLLATLLVIGTTVTRQAPNLFEAARPALVLAIPLLSLPLIAGSNSASRRAILVFAFTSSAVGGFQAAFGDPETFTHGAQTIEDPVNHNTYGSMLVLAFAILLAKYGAPGHRTARLWALVAAIVVAVAVGYSYSRSSYIGMLVVTALFCLRRSIRAAVVLAGLGLLALPLIPDSISERVGSTTTAGGSLEISSAARIDLWLSAIRMTMDYPLTGVGYLGFADQLPRYFSSSGDYSSSALQLDLLVHSHNLFLTILAETGLLGTALLVTVVAGIWRSARSSLRTEHPWIMEATILSTAGITVCCLFGEPLLTLPVLIPFMLILSTVKRITHD